MVVDTGRSYPHMPGIGVHHHGKLLEIFETVATTGSAAHGPSPRPGAHGPHREAATGRVESATSARTRRRTPRTTGSSGTRPRRSCSASSSRPAPGCTCCTPRPSAVVDQLRTAKSRGQDVSAELNPWAVFLGNDWANDRAPGLVRPLLLGTGGEHGAALGGAPRRHDRPRVDRPCAPHARGEGARLDRRLEGAHGNALGAVLRALAAGRGGCGPHLARARRGRDVHRPRSDLRTDPQGPTGGRG